MITTTERQLLQLVLDQMLYLGTCDEHDVSLDASVLAMEQAASVIRALPTEHVQAFLELARSRRATVETQKAKEFLDGLPVDFSDEEPAAGM